MSQGLSDFSWSDFSWTALSKTDKRGCIIGDTSYPDFDRQFTWAVTGKLQAFWDNVLHDSLKKVWLDNAKKLRKNHAGLSLDFELILASSCDDPTLVEPIVIIRCPAYGPEQVSTEGVGKRLTGILLTEKELLLTRRGFKCAVFADDATFTTTPGTRTSGVPDVRGGHRYRDAPTALSGGARVIQGDVWNFQPADQDMVRVRREDQASSGRSKSLIGSAVWTARTHAASKLPYSTFGGYVWQQDRVFGVTAQHGHMAMHDGFEPLRKGDPAKVYVREGSAGKYMPPGEISLDDFLNAPSSEVRLVGQTRLLDQETDLMAFAISDIRLRTNVDNVFHLSSAGQEMEITNPSIYDELDMVAGKTCAFIGASSGQVSGWLLGPKTTLSTTGSGRISSVDETLTYDVWTMRAGSGKTWVSNV